MKKQCTEYQFPIVSYIDGELEEESKREVFLHLAECGLCRSFWETVTDMKLQAAQDKRFAAPKTLDRRVANIATQNAPMRKFPSVWRNLVQSKLFVPAPMALILALSLLIGGAGIAFVWPSKPQPTKEVIEPVVYMKLPTVEVRGEVAQSKSAVR